jgi:hypothetical protein
MLGLEHVFGQLSPLQSIAEGHVLSLTRKGKIGRGKVDRILESARGKRRG